MHDMSKETFLRPDQLKRGVEIELTQRPEWGTAFIRGRVQGKPKLWDISKSMDKRGRFVDEDELLQHWRTPNMSNTRKEIAARLGFAAGNGAKVSFERYEIGDAFKFEDKIYVINSHANEINAVLSSADSNAKKALSLADFAHSKWLQFEGKAKSSRPGAKAEFAIDARDELMMRTWIKNNYPKADNAAFNKMLAKMTKEYAKDPKGYTYGGGFRAVAKAAGFSRDSAKAMMARWEESNSEGWGDLSKSLTATINGTKFEIVLDASTGKGTLMRGTQVVKEGAVEQLKKYAETVKASRPGTKTRMTREQTEEQKAGLKIMSAADPAVGAKIATLIKEGKPQDQAVAIALDMKRRGEL